MVMNYDPVAISEGVNVTSSFFYLPSYPMSQNWGRDMISMELLDISATDSAGPHSNKDLTCADCRLRQIFDFDDSFVDNHYCFHFASSLSV